VSVQIERIGSIEKIGDWRRFQLAVNGKPCVPVWMCEPEWRELEQRAPNEGFFWDRLAFISLIQTRNETPLSDRENAELAGAVNEIAQRRNAK
jgi:hypothetical protein